MKTTAGKCVLVAVVAILGVAKVPLVPAIIIVVVTLGTIWAAEKTIRPKQRTHKH